MGEANEHKEDLKEHIYMELYMYGKTEHYKLLIKELERITNETKN